MIYNFKDYVINENLLKNPQKELRKLMPKGKVEHSFRVAELVSKLTTDRNVYIAALFHDYIERGGSIDKISKFLPVYALQLIVALTKFKQDKGSTEDVIYDRLLNNSKRVNKHLISIKICDRIDNINKKLASKELNQKYLKKSENLFNLLIDEYTADKNKLINFIIENVQVNITIDQDYIIKISEGVSMGGYDSDVNSTTDINSTSISSGSNDDTDNIPDIPNIENSPNFEEYYNKQLLPFEGGVSKDVDDSASKGLDSNDKGNAHTNKGLTIRTAKSLYKKGFKFLDKNNDGKITSVDVEKWSTEDVKKVAKLRFWDYFKLDDFKSQLVASIIMSWGWGSGQGTAAKKIRKILNTNFNTNLKISAKEFSSDEVKVFNSLDQSKLFNTLKNSRKLDFQRIAKIGNNHKYLKGWLRRLNSIEKNLA